jgi:hypothetical protein
MKTELTQDYVDLAEVCKKPLMWHEKIYYPIYRFFVLTIWDNIRPGIWKHWYQRARYGHSYQDNWSIDYFLIENLIPMMKKIRYNRTGTPMDFFRKKDGVDEAGSPTDEAQDLADKRYDEVLDKIIYGLKCAKAINDLDYDYKDNKRTKQMMKSVEKSFQLIGKHLFSLWD